MKTKTAFLATILFLITGCDDGELRGEVKPSSDGKTYFGVIDNNGGQCGPLLLDGKPWQLELGEVTPINPGQHEITCGSSLAFTIPEGVIYKFDYWGP